MKYFDKSNLKEKGFLLAHSPKAKHSSWAYAGLSAQPQKGVSEGPDQQEQRQACGAFLKGRLSDLVYLLCCFQLVTGLFEHLGSLGTGREGTWY